MLSRVLRPAELAWIFLTGWFLDDRTGGVNGPFSRQSLKLYLSVPYILTYDIA